MNPFINPDHSFLKDGISVICAVKNRGKPLTYSLPSWLQQPGINQVILIDWDSGIPLWEELDNGDLPDWPDPRVMFVRAVNQPQWCLAKAFNLAACFARYRLLFKVDADVVCVDQLTNILPVPHQSFVTGDWRSARNENEASLNGTMLAATADFLSVGGYDERFLHYGWDDDDLYLRLQAQGLEHKKFTQNALFHLPHSTGLRTIHQDVGNMDPRDLVQVARKQALDRTAWSRNSNRTAWQFETQSLSGGRMTAIARENLTTH